MNQIVDIQKISKPFEVFLGFDKLMDQYEELTTKGSASEQAMANTVLSQLQYKNEMYKGVTVNEDWSKYQQDIELLTDALFPAPLKNNEIKIAIAPMSYQILRCTDRFKRIFKNDDILHSTDFKGLDEDALYIALCSFIMAFHYGINLKAKVPPVYPVENNRGIIQYYKSAYNAEFLAIVPKGKAPRITDEIRLQLEEGYQDVKVWKEVFPPESWEVHGFAIINFTDVSNEEAVSLIKNNLIGSKARTDKQNFEKEMNSYMSTLMDVPNLRNSFTLFNPNQNSFIHSVHNGYSCAMSGLESASSENMFCQYAKDLIFNQQTSFVMSDVDARPDVVQAVPMYRRMRDEGVKSFIITPIYDKEQFLGIIEYTSKESGAFQNKHLLKIDKILALATTSIKKYNDELESEKAFVIQKEFTSIHPSVEWKFTEEAERYLQAQLAGEEYNFDKIIFHDLIALFGQMDISGSSMARNTAIAADLKTQITSVRSIIDQICKKVDMPLLSSVRYQIAIIYEKLSSDLAAGMEQEVVEFLQQTINPLFEQMRSRDNELELIISTYFERIETSMDIVYDKRKDYDDTVKMINMHLSGQLDKAQEEAQRIYPHYFERYKTDGVEHNIFIGQELAPNLSFHKLYLDNLRLWQLKMICQLELEHNERKETYPVPLNVASLIMVYSNPLAIRYRMDEKQFDVDGAYNARYEIIKKRIDKAHIKGTDERITQPGKIVLIYTQPGDLDEYMNHINYLTYEGYIKGDPEIFEIEDLQGVVGLKGIRVSVNYDKGLEIPNTHSKTDSKADSRKKVEKVMA